VSQNRILRRMFGPKEEVMEDGENCVMRNFIIYTIPMI
jgi:hypothetical protein